ncbi:hypothetical protein [Stieleria marina]|uniref:Uncharacterized protein n=1 Tax=Stieleria marina TaxID=1930275 RepID=A0A517NWI9_9BACT|nr:hypothetical protein K239x_34790 [Planctomycetes bacterium K23_9]
MHKLMIPILFAIGTALFWGCYGPTIGNAQAPKLPGAGPAWSPFKPYVFIGVAYLVIAVVGGLVMMKVKGDSFSFSGVVPGTDRSSFDTVKWGFLAGTLGAAGALCLTSAMMFSKGNSALVMPIVFGGAVTVTAIVNLIKLRGNTDVNPLMWVGMALTLIGVVVVAKYTPHGHAPSKKADDTVQVEAGPSEAAPDTADVG